MHWHWNTLDAGQFRATEQTKTAIEHAQDAEYKYKRTFTHTFPNIPWAHIIRQDAELETDDGCTHFMNVVTGLFYAWNFFEDKWRHNKNGSDVACLFDASRVLAYKTQLQQ